MLASQSQKIRSAYTPVSRESIDWSSYDKNANTLGGVTVGSENVSAATGPWTKKGNVSYYATDSSGNLLRDESGNYVLQSAHTDVADDPWFTDLVKSRRDEINNYNVQDEYALSAPSVRDTADRILNSIQENSAATGRSPAELAGMGNIDLSGLGQAAGSAAASTLANKRAALQNLFTTEANLGTSEMSRRTAVSESGKSRNAARNALSQQTSNLNSFWDELSDIL